MGFQKSEANPKLYFIMVGDDPLILLLYVDGLIYHKGRETHCSLQEGSCSRVGDDRYWVDALFSGIGGLAGALTYFLGIGKVCC